MTRKLPNILLITADQWRGDHLGALGHPAVRSPHIDALAESGTLFTRHYTQAYPCGPARASLLTGLYPHKHRSVSNGIPLDQRHPTVFTALRSAGYQPLLFGYTDTTRDPRGRSEADPDNGNYENVCAGLTIDTLLTERATPWLADLHAKGYAVPMPDAGREGILRQRRYDQPTVFDARDSEAAFLSSRFIDWLAVSGEQPFCAHLSYIAPHPPFAAPAPFHQSVSLNTVPLPVRGTSHSVESAQHPLIAALYEQMQAGDFAEGLDGLSAQQSDETIQQVRAIYAGQIAALDQQIGRVTAALQASGHWDNTVIVFTADHGEQLFDHWMLGKTAYFDQSAHIPLIVRDPRRSADATRGQRVDHFTEAVDVLPTLLDAVGLDTPANADGRSLLSLCTGEHPSDWRDEVHWSYDFRDIRTRRLEQQFDLRSEWCNLQVIRTDRFKYVHFAGQAAVLFDLHADPHELVNRINDPAATALRLEALERLATWRQRHEDHALTGYLAKEGKLYRQQR